MLHEDEDTVNHSAGSSDKNSFGSKEKASQKVIGGYYKLKRD